jgi:hypothetical protein
MHIWALAVRNSKFLMAQRMRLHRSKTAAVKSHVPRDEQTFRAFGSQESSDRGPLSL